MLSKSTLTPDDLVDETLGRLEMLPTVICRGVGIVTKVLMPLN
jgi:hypothetical protein